ncbi:MAG: ferredoxin--NADP reductase [Candidimonas sp.]
MPDLNYTSETITEIIEWVPGKLFSFATTRPAEFQFTAGQFARLGLPDQPGDNAQPGIWRAYSMVTAPHQPDLAFYSIVVPNGEFTTRLARLSVGDTIYLDKTAFGFLTLERFEAGGDLWLLATGTGLSAYLSLLQDPHTWQRHERIILVHGVRQAEELAYREQLTAWAAHGHPDADRTKPRAGLTYLPIATRETLPGKPQARLTTLIEDGRLEQLAGRPLNPAHAKVMLCGNPDMIKDSRKLLTDRGFAVGRRGIPGTMAVENYW